LNNFIHSKTVEVGLQYKTANGNTRKNEHDKVAGHRYV